MAFVMRSCLLLVFCVGMLSLAELATAARAVPKEKAEDKKEPDCLGGVGVALRAGGLRTYFGRIPSNRGVPYVGGGRIPSAGGVPLVGGGRIPSVGRAPYVGSGGVGRGINTAPSTGNSGIDKSIPAASNPQFIPGFDDTFFPNPGYEVPNPVRGIIP